MGSKKKKYIYYTTGLVCLSNRKAEHSNPKLELKKKPKKSLKGDNYCLGKLL